VHAGGHGDLATFFEEGESGTEGHEKPGIRLDAQAFFVQIM
jgi:hypothetical protein